MNKGNRRILAALVMSTLVFGCGRDDVSTSDQVNLAEAPPLPPPPSIEQAYPQDLSPETEEAIARVDSIMIVRPEDSPDSVRILASGSVVSSGWTAPRLIAVDNENESDTSRSFRFVATSPAERVAAPVASSVEAQIDLEPLTARVTTIRILSATNELLAIVGTP